MLSSNLFVYHGSLAVLLHCAVSWINKQTNKQTAVVATTTTTTTVLVVLLV